MKYNQCAKCKLTLPIIYLIPIYAEIRGKIRQVFVCRVCKEILEERDKKENKNV